MSKAKVKSGGNVKVPKSSKSKVSKPPELGLKGQGVEALEIAEIDAALEKYIPARDERIQCSEVEDDAKKELMEALHKHQDKLIRETKGGFSYRFGDKLVTLKPSSEKLSVKSLHDEKANVED